MPLINKHVRISDFEIGEAHAHGVLALFMLDVENGCLVEMMTGDKFTFSSSEASVVCTPEGYALQFSGTQAFRLATPSIRGVFDYDTHLSAGNYMIAGRAAATAQQTANPGTIFGIAASAGMQATVGLGWDNSATPNFGMTFLNGNGAGTQSGSTIVSTLFKFETFLGWAHSGAGSYKKNWVNGLPKTPAEITGATSEADEVVFGAQHRAAGFLRHAKGQLLWGAILKGSIIGTSSPSSDNPSNDTAWSMYANDFPYNLFRRTRRILPGAAAAAFMARKGLNIPQAVNRASTF